MEKANKKKSRRFTSFTPCTAGPQSSSLPQSLAQRRLEQAHQKSVAKEASGHWEKQKHQGCVHCSYVVVIQKEVWELGLFEFFFLWLVQNFEGQNYQELWTQKYDESRHQPLRKHTTDASIIFPMFDLWGIKKQSQPLQGIFPWILVFI